MELREIKSIIDLMTRNGLAEFELEKGDVKIRIKRGLEGEPPSVTMGTRQIVVPHESVPTGTQMISSAGVHAPDLTNHKEIKSPMVGTFYRSPSPEAPSYVEIGQSVTEDTVVCIIEAMKVMNEIKAEVRGIITEVLAESAKPVEFGKPLFRVKVT